MTVENHRSKYPQNIDEKLRFLLERLRKIKETQVDRKIKWHKNHAKWHKIYFRVFGVLIIILSTSIPFVVAREFDNKNVVISIIALGIAALSGINSFFHWQNSWRSYIKTYFALKYLASQWELQILRIEQETDFQKARESALTATENLINGANSFTETDIEDFFKNIELPPAEKQDVEE
jgi:type IV secretory pathway VirB2 component (pilin)